MKLSKNCFTQQKIKGKNKAQAKLCPCKFMSTVSVRITVYYLPVAHFQKPGAVKDWISEHKETLQLSVQKAQLSAHIIPLKYASEVLPWKGEWPLKAEVAGKQQLWHCLIYFPSSADSSQTEVFWRKKPF